ncbi:MAG: hypothetical protein SW833_00945 [Cyanobacteriota bacterium]|nr:hypothetical protein [Cyanobacteriota bacterium]
MQTAVAIAIASHPLAVFQVPQIAGVSDSLMPNALIANEQTNFLSIVQIQYYVGWKLPLKS